MKKNILYVAFISILIGEAQPGPGRRGHVVQMMECFKKEFNPTPEQLDAIRKSFVPGLDVRAKREKLSEMRKAVFAKLRADGKEQDLLKDYEEVQKLQQEIGRARFERLLALRAHLTPEQKALWGNCQKQMSTDAVSADGE